MSMLDQSGERSEGTQEEQGDRVPAPSPGPDNALPQNGGFPPIQGPANIRLQDARPYHTTGCPFHDHDFLHHQAAARGQVPLMGPENLPPAPFYRAIAPETMWPPNVHAQMHGAPFAALNFNHAFAYARAFYPTGQPIVPRDHYHRMVYAAAPPFSTATLPQGFIPFPRLHQAPAPRAYNYAAVHTVNPPPFMTANRSHETNSNPPHLQANPPGPQPDNPQSPQPDNPQSPQPDTHMPREESLTEDEDDDEGWPLPTPPAEEEAEVATGSRSSQSLNPNAEVFTPHSSLSFPRPESKALAIIAPKNKEGQVEEEMPPVPELTEDEDALATVMYDPWDSDVGGKEEDEHAHQSQPPPKDGNGSGTQPESKTGRQFVPESAIKPAERETPLMKPTAAGRARGRGRGQVMNKSDTLPSIGAVTNSSTATRYQFQHGTEVLSNGPPGVGVPIGVAITLLPAGDGEEKSHSPTSSSDHFFPASPTPSQEENREERAEEEEIPEKEGEILGHPREHGTLLAKMILQRCVTETLGQSTEMREYILNHCRPLFTWALESPFNPSVPPRPNPSDNEIMAGLRMLRKIKIWDGSIPPI